MFGVGFVACIHVPNAGLYAARAATTLCRELNGWVTSSRLYDLEGRVYQDSDRVSALIRDAPASTKAFVMLMRDPGRDSEIETTDGHDHEDADDDDDQDVGVGVGAGVSVAGMVRTPSQYLVTSGIPDNNVVGSQAFAAAASAMHAAIETLGPDAAPQVLEAELKRWTGACAHLYVTSVASDTLFVVQNGLPVYVGFTSSGLVVTTHTSVFAEVEPPVLTHFAVPQKTVLGVRLNTYGFRLFGKGSEGSLTPAPSPSPSLAPISTEDILLGLSTCSWGRVHPATGRVYLQHEVPGVKPSPWAKVLVVTSGADEDDVATTVRSIMLKHWAHVKVPAVSRVTDLHDSDFAEYSQIVYLRGADRPDDTSIARRCMTDADEQVRTWIAAHGNRLTVLGPPSASGFSLLDGSPVRYLSTRVMAAPFDGTDFLFGYINLWILLSAHIYISQRNDAVRELSLCDGWPTIGFRTERDYLPDMDSLTAVLFTEAGESVTPVVLLGVSTLMPTLRAVARIINPFLPAGVTVMDVTSTAAQRYAASTLACVFMIFEWYEDLQTPMLFLPDFTHSPDHHTVVVGNIEYPRHTHAAVTPAAIILFAYSMAQHFRGLR